MNSPPGGHVTSHRLHRSYFSRWKKCESGEVAELFGAKRALLPASCALALALSWSLRPSEPATLAHVWKFFSSSGFTDKKEALFFPFDLC